MSSLGKKFVLWVTEGRPNAYKDQFGYPHRATVVLEEIEVVVTEIKNIPGNYTGKLYEGLLATSADGRVFTCNWNRKFPEESASPTVNWWDKNRNLVDACQYFNFAVYPCVNENGELAVPAGATHCKKHNFVFLPGDHCITCHYERAHD